MSRISLISKMAMEVSIITAVDPILRQVKGYQAVMLDLIGRLVECESPSDDRAAADRFVDLVCDTLAPVARLKTVPGGRFGRHLLAEMKLPGRRKSGQILALGHSDTVGPLGNLRTMPFRNLRGRLWGPGVLDMKAGIVFFIFAARSLRELDL